MFEKFDKLMNLPLNCYIIFEDKRTLILDRNLTNIRTTYRQRKKYKYPLSAAAPTGRLHDSEGRPGPARGLGRGAAEFLREAAGQALDKASEVHLTRS